MNCPNCDMSMRTETNYENDRGIYSCLNCGYTCNLRKSATGDRGSYNNHISNRIVDKVNAIKSKLDEPQIDPKVKEIERLNRILIHTRIALASIIIQQGGEIEIRDDVWHSIDAYNTYIGFNKNPKQLSTIVTARTR